MRIHLVPFGSAGDVLPFIWLGRHLQARGHDVVVITASLFKRAVTGAGLRFVPIGRDEEFESLLRDPRIWKMGHGTKAVFDHAATAAERFFDELDNERRLHGAPDLLLAPVTAFGARLAREKWDVPLVTVHLQPAVLLSAHDTPVIIPALHGLLRRLPVAVKQWLFHRGPNPVDLFAGKRLRRLCQLHGVPAPRSFFNEWWDSPDGVLVLFPEWFAPPQPDWPQPMLQRTFPLEDLAAELPLSTELDAFLTRHQDRPPVVFTAGSANVQAAGFFRTAVAALERLGHPGVLVTRDLTQLPASLPPAVIAVEYAAFGPLLRRAGAFVHHGGIGTLSQGFSAGLPQLVMPLAHDQPDNARRLERLGCGTFLTPRRFTAERVAATLDHLMCNADVRAACARVREQILADLGAQPVAACLDWLEQRATPVNDD